MNSLMLYPIVAGIGISIITAPLGVFVVWRRMAFFGDTLAHSALTGIALSFLLSLEPSTGLFIISTSIAIFLIFVQSQKLLATDTWLAITSHGVLAFGIVALSFVEGINLDITSYLFGDILTISFTDTIQIYGGALAILGVLALIWHPLLAITVNEDLARIEGIRVALVRATFMLLIALTIVLAIKIIGVLLLTAMLIIPAAAARRLAKTPEQMAILATTISILSVLSGVFISFVVDSPTSPTIVVAALCFFSISWLFPLVENKA